jgi:DNA-binding beta-propeller fold protein YncE
MGASTFGSHAHWIRRPTKVWATALAGWVLAACAGDDGRPSSAFGSGATSPIDDHTGGIDPADDDGGAASESGGDDAPRLDVGSGSGDADPDGPSGHGCGCSLNYIWIANSSEGTVSKINVRTLQEEGRYLTRHDGGGDPSRTSVNLAGDVAVANRGGGLVKFHADPSKCVESNGIAGIQTSTGPDDVLPWTVEECRAWHTDFPTTNQRPVAWTPGQVVEGTCDSSGEKVWTVASSTPFAPGQGGAGGVTAFLVNGDSGAIEERVEIEEFSGFGLGAYGGAVDGDGNLYFTPMGLVSFSGLLARVELDTLEVTLWPIPAGVAPYGITVDHEGRVWVSSTTGAAAARFDPTLGTWDTVGGFSSLGGLAEGDGLMWIAVDDGAQSVHVDNMTLGPRYTGGSGTTKGISVDLDGYVWAVDGAAHKFDPDTLQTLGTYAGLHGPYTYSDMTGGALGNVTCPTPTG